jgi:hypothetical protein
MKPSVILLGAFALLPLLAGTAGAQQCKTEIDNVAKLLASRDAGAGRTTGGARHPDAEKLASAQAALSRAREADRSDNEAECMRAITEAKEFAQ